MKKLIFAGVALLTLAGCETSGSDSSGVCPADVSQADRYKYPACDQQPAAAACPADVSEADRYKYPACN